MLLTAAAISGSVKVWGLGSTPAVMVGSGARRRLGFAGFVAVTVALDKSGKLAGHPVVVAEGLPGFFDKTEDGYEAEAAQAVADAVGAMAKPLRKDDGEVAEVARLAARRVARMLWNKKPVTRAAVIRV